MSRGKATPGQGTEHIFVGAATYRFETRRDAGTARRRGRHILDHDTRLDRVDVYCELCHKSWDLVADKPCEAAVDNTHLRGGPDGRKLRKHDDPDHDCERMECTPDIGAMRRAVGRA